MRAKEFIIEAIPLDQLRSAGSPETQANKDLSARLKQGMSSKPRNFVSKNAKMGGAGAHKDKKRAEKQGDVKHKAKQFEEGVAEAEKNPHTSALGKALYRDLSKEKKASPQQVEKNKARWAQRQGDKEQGVAEGRVPNFLDDDFYAYDPETMEIKGTWSHKSVGRRHHEYQAQQEGWNVVSGMRAKSLGLHYPDKQGAAEGWKSKVAGAALAGAAALGGGGAQASEPVTPLAVMATIKMKLPDGSIKTIKKDLGHSYDYRLDDARKDLENVLDRKGIKNYTIHLDRYNAGDADATAPEKTKDYMDKTPFIGKADDNKNYMNKGPYTSKPSKTTYLDKSTGKEFRDMNNY